VITAGIDVGAENVKTIILDDGRILSHSVASQGTEATLSVALRGLNESIEKAGITRSAIEYVVATGIGSKYISFADRQATESSCCARGVTWLLPSTGTVIDMGADKCLVVRCKHGRPSNTVRNDRCAAGTGRFLEIAAKPLGLDVGEMGQLALKSRKDVDIESTCAVFAESEIISLIHSKHHPEDIAWAVFNGLASRIYTMILKVGFERDLAMVGGLTKNVGMVKAVEEQAGCHILIPEEPIVVGALGAALIAADKNRGSFDSPIGASGKLDDSGASQQ
jgi:predicted CoA-substrate-specific enzyme activase